MRSLHAHRSHPATSLATTPGGPRPTASSSPVSRLATLLAAGLIAGTTLATASGCDTGPEHDPAWFDLFAPGRDEGGITRPDAGPDAEPDVDVDILEPLPLDCEDWDELEDNQLVDAVFLAINDHVVLDYFTARNRMFDTALSGEGVDLFDGVLECIYTGRTTVPDGTRVPDDFNTEHIWPQSQGAGDGPARSDIHHLSPVDATANSARFNYAFGSTSCGEVGEVPCEWTVGGSRLGYDAGGNLIFDVRPERRGDVARAKFYVSIRYGFGIGPAEELVLREWHAQDPPDDRELERNRRVAALQGRLNPFITCPDIVDRISDF